MRMHDVDARRGTLPSSEFSGSTTLSLLPQWSHGLSTLTFMYAYVCDVAVHRRISFPQPSALCSACLSCQRKRTLPFTGGRTENDGARHLHCIKPVSQQDLDTAFIDRPCRRILKYHSGSKQHAAACRFALARFGRCALLCQPTSGQVCRSKRGRRGDSSGHRNQKQDGTCGLTSRDIVCRRLHTMWREVESCRRALLFAVGLPARRVSSVCTNTLSQLTVGFGGCCRSEPFATYDPTCASCSRIAPEDEGQVACLALFSTCASQNQRTMPLFWAHGSEALKWARHEYRSKRKKNRGSIRWECMEDRPQFFFCPRVWTYLDDAAVSVRCASPPRAPLSQVEGNRHNFFLAILTFQKWGFFDFHHLYL